jgi:L-ascorbate metabolism protein UlaG (beta-lactamase superfamily)
MLESGTIEWLGHASFRITFDNKILYIDPWEITAPKPADIIFITHSHFDHFSPQDIQKIAKDGTCVIGPQDIKGKVPSGCEFIEVKPGDEKEVSGIKFEVVPAYNVNKQFHPRDNNWVGYVIYLRDTRIYHPGDTDLIPEMEGLKPDIALLPIGGTYTMNAEEAAQAVKIMGANKVVPMHYGKIVGSDKDLKIFKSNLPPEVELLTLPITQ